MATATTAADPAATKAAIRDGVTLVAKYKGEQHSCEVVEHDGRLHYVLPGRGRAKPKVFTSPSAAGRAITGSQVNGYRFWSVPEQSLSGQAARQKAARAAVVAANGAPEPSEPSTSEHDTPQG